MMQMLTQVLNQTKPRIKSQEHEPKNNLKGKGLMV